MGRHADLERLLNDARDIGLTLREPLPAAARSRLEGVRQGIALRIGPSVPKSVAAALLGVSVTAVDRWLERGALPAVSRPGARTEVGTDPLLELAVEVASLRGKGLARSVVATALSRLPRRLGATVLRSRQLPPLSTLPRPNASATELSEAFAHSRVSDRVLQTAELSYAATVIAAAARAARGCA